MELLEKRLESLCKWPLQQRNQLIDSLFYDIGALTADEQTKLSPLIDREGTIVVVSPRTVQREDKIRHYENALRFMVREGDTVRAIAVAGVGSSVLGTAALARNIADCYGIDVAGIVTGYGMADLIAEALGGWFFYGGIDRLRHAMELITENLFRTLPKTTSPLADAAASEHHEDMKSGLPFDSRFITPGNTDAGTLLDILTASRNLRLLVGHSKGNLLISFVLRHMVRELGSLEHPYYDKLNVVTLGAVVDFPGEFKKVHQFLGQYDILGWMNSNFGVPRESPVSGAGHHLNPQIPFCMSVQDVLRKVKLAPPAEGPDVRSMVSPERAEPLPASI